MENEGGLYLPAGRQVSVSCLCLFYYVFIPFMHKKSGFTIIEMMIVMAIIGIMIVMTQNYFTSANKIYYEGEACINNMYYAIKDISNAALLGRTRTLS